jgi:hypothetical protein
LFCFKSFSWLIFFFQFIPKYLIFMSNLVLILLIVILCLAFFLLIFFSQVHPSIFVSLSFFIFLGFPLIGSPRSQNLVYRSEKLVWVIPISSSRSCVWFVVLCWLLGSLEAFFLFSFYIYFFIISVDVHSLHSKFSSSYLKLFNLIDSMT